MAEELTYVLINPYTIIKSRTGGVIARLFARSSLKMVAARMFSPSQKLADEFADSVIKDPHDENSSKIAHLIREYVLKNYAPYPETGQRKRVMMLLFRGENATRKLLDEVAGHITYATVKGETIRDTYGDYIENEKGEVTYFEPAVICPPDRERAQEGLAIWSKYSETDGGILDDVIVYPDRSNVQNTLVMIKPDNFKLPSIRVGNIIDMFSKTGLYVIGVRQVHMSVEQAETFYGPVKAILEDKMKDRVEEKVQKMLRDTFEFSVPEQILKQLTTQLNPLFTTHEFNKIIEFITGKNPAEEHAAGKKLESGTQTCLALVYQGVDAVSKIRAVLGSTDPSKAAPATVRKEFGQDIMVNSAHASDSPENAKREIDILDIAGNDIKREVEAFCT